MAEEAWLRAGDRGAAVRPAGAHRAASRTTRRTRCATSSPLTGKPVLFVANVDEGDDAVPAVVADHAAADGRRGRRDLLADRGRAVRARRRRGGRDARGARASASPASSASSRGAFGLLDLIAFFTAGEDKPAQSWHLRRGLTAWHAAGEIHSDIQRGFVRAEVIGWDALVEAGGYAGARDRGTLRLEGRDYVMADGDVITVKFTP